MNRISQKDIIEYEIAGHWLSQYMWNEWSQRKLGRYIGRKTVRKYRRYLYVKEYRSGKL